ncbi:MAG: hypothetical protein ACJ8AT_01430 [Hyalangium sp.]|uniref:hypothetical protein n=1 Tax=Hyalangium sp. TaxID=2028555 RepID=UPI00389B20C8
MELDELVLNPYMDIVAPPGEEGAARITVQAPVKGYGLRVHEITAAKEPLLFEVLSALVKAGGELELDAGPEVVEALHRIGLLVKPEELSEWPRYRVAAEPAAELLPLRVRESRPERADVEGLIVAPSFLFQREFQLRPDIAWPRDFEQEGRLRCFAEGPAFWVEYAPTGVQTPFWVEPRDAEALAALRPGQPPPELEPRLRALLRATGALIDPATQAQAEHSRQALFRTLKAGFHGEGFSVCRDLLHPFEIAALRIYFRDLLAAGLIQYGDDPTENRYIAHNEPVSRMLHARLRHLMDAVVGEPVKPSYSFLSYYQSGARLKRHIDREQSRYSISLQVDYLPEPAGPTGWPLGFITVSGQEGLADLRLGDAAVYRGVEIPHFRPGQLPATHSSSHLILEYVLRSFTGILD